MFRMTISSTVVCAAAASLLALTACQSPQTADGENVTAASLATSPDQGPELFGPLEEGATVQSAPVDVRQPATSSARGGNSARVGRSAEPRTAPARPTTTTVQPTNSPPQIAAQPPVESEDGFVTTSSGLRYKDIEVGHGAAPLVGQTVLANYQGWLYEGGRRGDLFDRSRGAPFNFDLGTGQVIRGWDEGFSTMRPGGKRILIIPPHLAYGTSGAGGLIPPNATLMFEVELLEVR